MYDFDTLYELWLLNVDLEGGLVYESGEVIDFNFLKEKQF